jgi:nucleoside-diphosphate-sugar epimerase
MRWVTIATGEKHIERWSTPTSRRFNRRNPTPLVRDNLAMGLNIFEACRELGVNKLVAACSVCAYPKFTPVPFKEDGASAGSCSEKCREQR